MNVQSVPLGVLADVLPKFFPSLGFGSLSLSLFLLSLFFFPHSLLPFIFVVFLNLLRQDGYDLV
jgi:hypothetical protein